MESKTNQVNLRLSDTETAMLGDLVDATGMTQSEVLRTLITGAHGKLARGKGRGKLVQARRSRDKLRSRVLGAA